MLGQVQEEFAALSVFEDEVEFFAVLEGVVEFDNKRVPDGLEDGTFGAGLLDHLFVHDKGGLFELFLRVELAGGLVADQYYGAITFLGVSGGEGQEADERMRVLTFLCLDISVAQSRPHAFVVAPAPPR